MLLMLLEVCVTVPMQYPGRSVPIKGKFVTIKDTIMMQVTKFIHHKKLWIQLDSVT